VQPWELIARESIRDLVARYNANGDSGRLDQVVDLFAPQAVLDVKGVEYVGRDAIRAFFADTATDLRERSGPAYLRHFTATLQIDVDSADRARSRCYYAVLMADGLDHWGRYLDEFALVVDRWLFSKRRVTLDGFTPTGWAAARNS